MPKRPARTIALVGPLLFATALAAQETPPPPQDTGQVATALRGGNLGMGLDVMYGLAPEVTGRAGFTLSGGTSSLSAAGKTALDAVSQPTFVEKSRFTPTISVGASYRF